MLRGRMSQQQQQQQQQQNNHQHQPQQQSQHHQHHQEGRQGYHGPAPGASPQDRAHSTSIQMYHGGASTKPEERTVAFPPTPPKRAPLAGDIEASGSDDDLASVHVDRLHSWMVDHGSLPPVLHRADGKASQNQCIFNMVNALLAIGLLGFPYCFRSCGVLLTALLMALSYLINIFSTSVLLVMAQIAGKVSYEELAAYALGMPGRLAVMGCLFSLNLGCLVAYVNILADVLSSVAGTIIPPAAEASRDLLLVSVCIFAVLPVSLAVRTSDLMASVSTASLGFLGVFTLVVVIFAFAPIEDASPVKFWDGAGMALSMPVVLYAFTSHTVLFSVYSTMRSPSVTKMKSVISRSLIICGLAYFAAGVGGYLAFRQRTAGDVLRNLGGSGVPGLRALYERALRLGYGLAALGCVPLVMLPLQHTILPILMPLAALVPRYGRWLVAPVPERSTRRASIGSAENEPQSPRGYNLDGMDISSPLAMALTLALTGLALLCALFLPNVELILGLMGSTGAVGVGMVLPGAITLRVMSMHSTHSRKHFDPMTNDERKWKKVKLQAWAMLVGGLLLAAFSTRHLLRAVQEEKDVVKLAQQLHAKEELLLQATEVEQKARDMRITVDSVEQAEETLKGIQGSGDGQGPVAKDEASMESALGTLKQTKEILEKGGNEGLELALREGDKVQEVDKDLEAVEDIVEDVAKQIQDSNTVHESEVALGIVPKKQTKPEAEAAAQQQLEEEEEDSEGAEGSEAVVAASKHHRPLHRPTVDELKHKANSASNILEMSLQQKEVQESNSEGGRSSMVADKLSSKLDAAIHALEQATEVQPGLDGKINAPKDVVDTALNATYDATTALNTTLGAVKESTATELRRVVDKVQSLMGQLQQLDIPPEGEQALQKEGEERSGAGAEAEAGGDEGAVHGERAKTGMARDEKPDELEDDSAQKGNVAAAEGGATEPAAEMIGDAEAQAGVAKEQLREKVAGADLSWHVNATRNVSDVADKAVQAAEAARSAALSDIKTAVLKADPRVASRAEEIAAELTLLGAIESMEAQNRLDEEKASLGMSVKTVTFGNGSAASEMVPESADPARGGSAEAPPHEESSAETGEIASGKDPEGAEAAAGEADTEAAQPDELESQNQEWEDKKREQEERHKEWEAKQDSSAAAAELWAKQHPVGR